MNDPLRKCPTCDTPVDETVNMGLRDYRWVADALPGREAPMDLDFVLEKKGNVLIMENKPEGLALPMGQLFTLQTFRRMGADVWIAWESKDHKSVEVGALGPRGVGFVEKMSVPKLKRRVREWRDLAAEEA